MKDNKSSVGAKCLSNALEKKVPISPSFVPQRLAFHDTEVGTLFFLEWMMQLQGNWRTSSHLCNWAVEGSVLTPRVVKLAWLNHSLWSSKNALVLAADVILTVGIEIVPIFIVKTYDGALIWPDTVSISHYHCWWLRSHITPLFHIFVFSPKLSTNDCLDVQETACVFTASGENAGF